MFDHTMCDCCRVYVYIDLYHCHSSPWKPLTVTPGQQHWALSGAGLDIYVKNRNDIIWNDWLLLNGHSLQESMTIAGGHVLFLMQWLLPSFMEMEDV